MSDDRLWAFWLTDMLEAIEKIQSYTKGFSKEAFVDNRQVRDAVAMNIANIGEASTHIPERIVKKYDYIPWREIKAMRNLIAHNYPGISWEQVWKAVESRLTELETQLLNIQKNEID